MSDDTLTVDAMAAIRDIPDFPKAGILFKDITPLLSDGPLFDRVIAWMCDRSDDADKIVGMESRGFIFGAPMVSRTGAGFVPARKPGKLPYETVGVDYALEYGTARLELHVDAVQEGDRVVIVDDLLATGGTAAATVELVRKLGADPVAAIFLVELGFLDGRAKLGDLPVHSLITY